MAPNNEITLETKRCIFVDNNIYFSNYYLNSKSSEVTGPVNKIMFDTTEFMNTTMIQEVNKKTVPNQLEITLPNPLDLNESLYSKVNIQTKDTKFNVNEDDILKLQIFKDIDQIRQFLQFDGWWCSEAQHTDFDQRVKPVTTSAVPSAATTSQTAGTGADTGSQPAAAGPATGSQPATAGASRIPSWIPIWGQQSVPQPGQQSGQQPGQPSVQQQTIGGSKQTRSTRNHKNRKSKKN